MKVWELARPEELADLPEQARGGIVALGTFDGVHRGHQVVLRRAQEWATREGKSSAVLTFPWPPLLAGAALTSPEEKVRLLAELGIDQVFLLAFTPALAAWTPQRFVREALLAGLGAAGVVTGENYTFGRGGRAGPQTLAALAGDLRVEVVPPALDGGVPISSSRIRAALRAGEVEKAAGWLGRPPSLEGKVVQGDRLGRRLGFPTANLALPAELLRPRTGVYAVRAFLPVTDGEENDGKGWVGVLNLGYRPTFAGDELRVEVFLPYWQGDLYGRRLRVELYAYLRPERRFAGAEELQAQIKEDVTRALTLLGCS